MTCAPPARLRAAIARLDGGADGLASSASSAVLSHFDGVDDEHIVAADAQALPTGRYSGQALMLTFNFDAAELELEELGGVGFCPVPLEEKRILLESRALVTGPVVRFVFVP